MSKRDRQRSESDRNREKWVDGWCKGFSNNRRMDVRTNGWCIPHVTNAAEGFI